MTYSKARLSTEGAKTPEWMQSENTQLYISENMVLVDNYTPIDPKSGKPYFKINKNAWDGEWLAGEVQTIPSGEFGGDHE